jgi:hypothetical protein
MDAYVLAERLITYPAPAGACQDLLGGQAFD